MEVGASLLGFDTGGLSEIRGGTSVSDTQSDAQGVPLSLCNSPTSKTISSNTTNINGDSYIIGAIF